MSLAWLYERVLQRALQWHRGRRVKRATDAYAQILSLDPAAAHRAQTAALRTLLLHAYDTSALHRARMDASDADPRATDPWTCLSRLPILDRSTVIRSIDEIVSDRWPREQLWASASGGTTGAAATFYLTHEDAAHKNDLGEAMRRRMGLGEGERRAFLWGAVRDLPVNESHPFFRRMKAALVARWLERCIVFSANVLTDDRLDRYLKKLRRFRPHWMQAYPSAMDQLARRAIATGTRLRIPTVILTAEPTTTNQRRRIAEAFQSTVMTWYGSREAGWIAAECREHQQLHLNTAAHVVESLDDGQIVITDFHSNAMPLIRYAIGDRGSIDPTPCKCGNPSPVLRLEGRTQGLITLPSGAKVPTVAFTERGLGVQAPGILEIQVRQREPRVLDVYYIPAPAFVPANLDWLVEDIRRTTCGELEIRTHEIDELMREPNGKVLHATSTI